MKNVLIKTLVSLFLAAALLFSSCNGRTSGSHPVTITILLLGNKPINGRADAAIAEINEITAKRIGAVLRTRYIEWADWQSQYQLALASGNKDLDLVITSTTWLYGWEIARRGGFYPLTPELLYKNAPQTWAAVPPSHWDLCTENGKIWFIPEDQFSQYTIHGMFWRKDWAMEGGLEDIIKFEDLEKYWDIVKKNHPEAYPWDIGGMDYLIPGLIEGYMAGKKHVQPILTTATGNYSIFQYDTADLYTVISYYMEGDELVKAAELFDRWAKKGFWREDVLNSTLDQMSVFYTGSSGSAQHHTNIYLNFREQMDREQPGSDIQIFWWGKENNNARKNLITHGAMGINAASRNVEKALQMYDLLRNDKEIYLLFNYGIEGRDYTVNKDGVFSRPGDFNSLTDNLETNFWGGRMDEFEPVWDTWWSGRKDFINHLDSFAHEYPLEKFVFDSSKVSAEMAAMGDVCITYIPTIQFGKTGNPEQAVGDFRAALKRAGYDKVKMEIQSQLDRLKQGGE